MKLQFLKSVALTAIVTLSVCFNSNNQAQAGINPTDSTSVSEPTKKQKITTTSLGAGDWFGKTLSAETNTGNFKVKGSVRVQPRFDLKAVQDENGNMNYEDELRFRRARLKLDGHLFSSDFKYKFEYDLVNQQILDLVLKYQAFDGFWIWAGQTKLPGNRERVVSSQNLQFVDRSLLNSYYTSDRDLAVQLRYNHELNNGFVMNEAFAVSTGEGKNYYAIKDYDQIFQPHSTEGISTSIENGLNYIGRVELMPFGKFSKKGDYHFADFVREKSPKLSIGVSYEYNQDAFRSKGQRGSELSGSKSLKTVFADAFFKYQGFNAFVSYAHKTTSDGSAVVLDDPANDAFEAFQVGQALNMQAGYLFKNNFELAARTTMVRPEVETQQNDIEEYTLALSKYIIKHYLKVQTDVSYRNIHGAPNTTVWRLQMELGF